ncbi:endonuclease III [Thermovirga sp.]|uniref:endonuclease III domain-containing protein n=1 Tax=Thermovirga sp. TaxID=2699834 RepID=UPI0025F2EBC3|nr:endonuclease III [Thermovirga sp.]
MEMRMGLKNKTKKINRTTDVYGNCTSEKVIASLDLLEETWGNEKKPIYESFEDPIDGLIKTVLSQNTNDANRDNAWQSLKHRFPSWDKVMSAEVGEVATAIRSAGIANVKAQRIKTILTKINNSLGECSLKKLRDWHKEDIKEFLGSLPGVGPKTVACVLLFDIGIPAFPVDTHVARISKRLGFIEEKTSPIEIERFLENVVPEERFLGGHLNMIAHGRAICKAVKPKCTTCPLANLCELTKSRGDSS